MKSKSFFLDEIGWLLPGWVIAVILLVLYVAVGAVLQIDVRGQRAGIEQMRIDIAQIGCSAAEDAIGLAIETNRTIKATRYWAHNWFTGLAVPNGWDDIILIEIPNCQ